MRAPKVIAVVMSYEQLRTGNGRQAWLRQASSNSSKNAPAKRVPT